MSGVCGFLKRAHKAPEIRMICPLPLVKRCPTTVLLCDDSSKPTHNVNTKTDNFHKSPLTKLHHSV